MEKEKLLEIADKIHKGEEYGELRKWYVLNGFTGYMNTVMTYMGGIRVYVSGWFDNDPETVYVIDAIRKKVYGPDYKEL